MAARSQLHDPLNETPFWRSRGFVLGIISIAVISLAGLTMWLVKMNERQQMQWRLDDDPKESRLKETLVKQIAAGKPGQARAPVALWLGRVKEYREFQGTDGSAVPESLLWMEDASLLAGTRAKSDGSDSLTIRSKQYVFGGPLPRAGEKWLVAVWRESDGNNVIHTAIRAGRK